MAAAEEQPNASGTWSSDIIRHLACVPKRFGGGPTADLLSKGAELGLGAGWIAGVADDRAFL